MRSPACAPDSPPLSPGRAGPLQVRLTIARDGGIRVESSEVAAAPSEVTAVIAEEVAVDEEDRFHYHKTTHRGAYEKALAEARRRGAREAVLRNRRGEIAGAASGNVLVQTEAGCFTPPLASGLLPGTMRAELLAAGEARERPMRVEDLASAQAVYRIDSVRRRVRLRILEMDQREAVPTGQAAAFDR